ncbi:MAG: PEP-CTERM sorting domain-containing protein [Candidatus Contendobacter sp.]|nr:PEP-CTERM sorting domain-containing protein [Candidatus Contendobacter sp.]
MDNSVREPSADRCLMLLALAMVTVYWRMRRDKVEL